MRSVKVCLAEKRHKRVCENREKGIEIVFILRSWGLCPKGIDPGFERVRLELSKLRQSETDVEARARRSAG